MPEKDPPGYTDPIPVFTNKKMRLWGGEVTCPRSQSELITEWRRCPKSPDSRLHAPSLRTPVSSENFCKINLLERSLENVSKATGLLESHFCQKSPRGALLHCIPHDSVGGRAVPKQWARRRWATKSLSGVCSSCSALWPKEVCNWTCNSFIGKEKSI